MKIRRSIFFIGTVAIVILLLLVIARKTKHSQNLPQSDRGSNVESIDLQPSNTASAQASQKLHANPAAFEERNAAQSDATNFAQEEWRTPISFYGQVVDQDRNPIANVNIVFDWTDLSTNGSSETSTVSNAKGFFSLEGVAGKHLSVRIGKEGYYTPQTNTDSFFYAGENENFVPNAAEPVIFVLQKKGNAEQLIHIAGNGLRKMKDYPLSKDGNTTTTEISLTDGQLVAADKGDLQIQFQVGRPLKNSAAKYTWSCRIAIPRGGLIQTSDEFPFYAPQEGYQKTDEWTIDADHWTDEVKKQYYVKLQNGNYGRINLRVVASDQPLLRLEAFVNPSGSRNLEFQGQK